MLRRDPFTPSAFGTFQRSDGRDVFLLEGYRDLVKARWRSSWWPLATLLALDANRAVTLPPELAEVAIGLRAARTLSVRPEEVAHRLKALFDERPDWFAAPTRHDSRYGMSVLEPVVERDPPIDAYRRAAEELRQLCERCSIDLHASRVLEVGCGAGYQAFAVAAIAGEVVGIDLDIETYDVPARRERMRDALLGSRAGAEVRIETGDVMDLRFDDDSFDVVVSNVVLEHVRDVPRAFAEMRRVLRPGGVSVNGVQPWFAPAGGHSLCTLDFPWGHARLGEEDFVEYVAAWRPLEAEDAVGRYRTGFQQPRLTLAESRTAARNAGMSIVRWEETPLPLRDVHRGLATPDVLDDCRRVNQAVTMRDLLTIGYRAVLRCQ